MSEAKTIWKHTRVYGLGNVLNRVAAFLLIPVLLHSLSVEQWGAYALIVVVTELLVHVFAVISDGMARVYFDYDDDEGRQEESQKPDIGNGADQDPACGCRPREMSVQLLRRRFQA